MPTLQDLEAQRQKAAQSQETATRVTGYPSSFEAKVRAKLGEAQAQAGPDALNEMMSTATKQFVEQPVQLREQYKFADPYTRMNAIAQMRSGNLSEMQRIGDLQSQRYAGVDNLLEGIRLGMQAEAQQAAMQPQYEQQTYQNMFSEWENQQQQAQQLIANALNEREMKLEEEKYQASLAGGLYSRTSSGGSTADQRRSELSSLLASMMGGGETIVEDYDNMQSVPMTTQGGLSEEKARALMVAFPEEQGYIQKIYEFGQPTEMSAAKEKRSSALSQVGSVVSDLVKEATQAKSGILGSLQATFGKFPGVSGGQAEMLSRDVEGYARLIASGLASEVGVATDKDVERWKSIMPKPGDPLGERVQRLDTLVNRIKAESSSYGQDINMLTLQDSSTGDVYEAENIQEYIDSINSGKYVPY